MAGESVPGLSGCFCACAVGERRAARIATAQVGMITEPAQMGFRG